MKNDVINGLKRDLDHANMLYKIAREEIPINQAKLASAILTHNLVTMRILSIDNEGQKNILMNYYEECEK